MRRMHTILVGASLNESGDPVLLAAASLAQRTGARLHLAHAFQLPVADEPLAVDWGVGRYLEEEQAALEARLASQLERLALEPDGLAGVSIEVGAPHRLLVETAAEVGANLIVLGAQESRSPFARWLGSTADRVVRKASCPVWVVREPVLRDPERVLLPVDLSKLSADVVDFALEFLQAEPDGAEPLLEALLVLDNSMTKGLALRSQGASSPPSEVAERDLETFLAARPGGGAGVGRRLREGEVVEGIVAEIDQWRPDLVVMGTHGRGGFERFMIGSIAAGVLRYASCSVLVVPPGAAFEARRQRAGGSR